MARIVEKLLPGHRTPVYYYQHSYRIKLRAEDRGKGPNSGPSRVRTESVYLGNRGTNSGSLPPGTTTAGGVDQGIWVDGWRDVDD